MSNTGITFTIDANTLPGSAAMQKFYDEQVAGINRMVSGAAALNLPGNNFTKLAESAKNASTHIDRMVSGAAALNLPGNSFTKLAESAKNASTHIAGMSYYFRSAIDGIRAAAAGGGERAVFYALDELLRGLLASGLKLSKLVPVLGSLVVAVSAGVWIWEQFTRAEKDAAKQAKETADALDKLPAILERINKLQQAGRLGSGAASEYSDYLNGTKKLYRRVDGTVTTTPTQTVDDPGRPFGGGVYSPLTTFGPNTAPKPPPDVRKLPQLSMKEVQEYVDKQLGGQGGPGDPQVESIAKLRELEKQALQERLEGLELEKAEIHDKFQKQRDEITAAMQLAGSQLTNQQRAAAEEAIRQLNLEEAVKKSEADEKARLEVLKKLAQAREEELRAVKQQEEEEKKALELAHAKWEALKRATEEERQQKLDAARGAGIDIASDPTMSDREKSAALIQNLELQKSLTEKVREQEELQKRINQEQAQFSVGGQLMSQLTQMTNAYDVFEKDLASTLLAPIKGFRDGFEKAFNDMITKGTTFKQFMGTVGLGMLRSFEDALFKMVTDFVTQHLFMENFRRLLQALDVTETTTKETEKTALVISESVLRKGAALGEAEAWLAVAAMSAAGSVASIPYVGWLMAIAAMAETEATGNAIIAGAAVAGYAEGGFTGPGGKYDAAGIVHRGEFVMPADAVNRIGLAPLEAMRSGAAVGGSVGASPVNIQVLQFTDMHSVNEHARNNPEFHHIIVGIGQKNAHVIPARNS